MEQHPRADDGVRQRSKQNGAIIRLTFRKRGPVRLEFYFTFRPEANELRLSETDVSSISFLYDLQSGDTDADALRGLDLQWIKKLTGPG